MRPIAEYEPMDRERFEQEIVPLVKEVIIMGGSITGGNVNGAAEANIYGDPEAAAIVFNAGWMVTMVGLSARAQPGNLALIRSVASRARISISRLRPTR